MTLERPEAFGVTHEGERTDLLGALEPTTVMGSPGFALEHGLDRPGTHVFAMEPQPYWEPAEDSFITHYTKTYVSAFGDDAGWDAELGLPTEIVPLSKPFGLYEGNVFQGIVKLDGEPVPFAEVEVEHLSEDAPGRGALGADDHPDGQGRRGRGVHLRRPGGWLVGLRGAQHGGLHPAAGGHREARGARRRALGALRALGRLVTIRVARRAGAADPAGAGRHAGSGRGPCAVRPRPLAAARSGPWLGLALAMLLAASPALAHRLNVFASVEDGTVVVEASFPDGGPARAGTVRIYDARDRLIRTLSLAEDGTARFPVEGATDGLRVEVDAGDGHSDYWILTPADLAGAAPTN